MSLPSIPNLSSSSLEPATGPRFSLIVTQGDSTIKLWFLIFFIVQANLSLTILLPQPVECWDCRHHQCNLLPNCSLSSKQLSARLGRVRETETLALF